MNYVYHASKIIGYEDIVFHYRRLTSAEQKSITSAVSKQKVKDYLLSHDMIYDAIATKFLREQSLYNDFDTLKAVSYTHLVSIYGILQGVLQMRYFLL